MADEPTATAPAEAPAPPTNDVTESTSAAEPTNAAAAVEAPIAKEDEETAGKQATTEVNAPEGRGTAEAAAGPTLAEGAATPSNKKTPSKSSGGSASKAKGKRKSMPVLRLECEPGEYYWARLKGHPPWPAIVCDEQMLPESLLATRPVSTARPDGTLRDDFKPGGKNAKERTFPIMFLSTNEFAWMINTSLTPLEPSECETLPNGKMTKALQAAYKIASEGHDLAYFKDILKTWQEEQAEIEKINRELEEKLAMEKEERERKKAAAASEPKKKKPRKSKGGDEDVDMEDADAPKSSKKRKTEAEGEADGAKPKKTPKVTKINAPKTPSGEDSAKKTPKSKKKIVTAPKETEEEKPQMTEEERLQQREKAVLYLRHRLQKGFLSRDQAPQEGEMATMSDFFKQLEAYKDLEPSIIRTTKIHKVLKAIVKLISIPREEEYLFKKRSSALLDIWNKRMESDGGAAAASDSKAVEGEAAPEEKNGEPAQVNGDAKEDGAAEEEKKPIDDKPETATDLPEQKADEPAAPAEVKTDDAAAAAVTDTAAGADKPAEPAENVEASA